MYIVLYIINIILLLSSASFGIYFIVEKEYTLAVSIFSVLAASISGLVATMVMKANKDKERPYIGIEPDYSKYGVIQIKITNLGTELAIIEKVNADNTIKLRRGENFLGLVEGLAIPANDYFAFPLMLTDEYPERNAEVTSQGYIVYRDINNKRYQNKFFFNIENQGSTLNDSDPSIKTHYTLQQLPNELKRVTRELKITNQILKQSLPKSSNQDTEDA